MRRVRSNLTYSNVASTLCLVLLLGGGTAYAAGEMLPKVSVGTKQIQKEAVTPSKLSKASKAALTGPAGSNGATGATGATGPQGPKGDPGEAGTARAYARVAADGTIDPADSKNVISATTAGGSLLCFKLPFTPVSVSATVEGYSADQPNPLSPPYGTVVAGVGQGPCGAGTNAYTATSDTAGSNNIRLPVFVVFN
jgi:hypothetical protein